ncbi:DEAD-box ATP-dependent RNA helicase 58-chloroplastic [Striga hermonthica]|uniref:RNA helicase n=1 Tax=Striga hermonthica TaxID=68872 RepID=A0A9N7NP94_STRHE|nr:DEAD-box ATP-dependent RNA helicase 58-chloroplastic [Striga hermonthica]
MACSSALHLNSFPLTSNKPLSASSARPNSTFWPYSNGTNRMIDPLSVSASLGSNCVGATDVETTKIDCPTLTLRELCRGHVPEHIMHRAEEIGYITPTSVQKEALPVLFSGRDCVIQAQTGSGKTLAYLLLILSVVNARRSAVQALIVVPTRELGMQVTKVARTLAARSLELESEQKACSVMALLDGGTLRRHKSWLKAEPPAIVIATLKCLCQMLDRRTLKLDSMRVLVIDEVDFMFYSSKEVSSLRKLLTSFSSIQKRQTIFAKRYSALVHLLQSDAPQSAIIFVGEQSEKSKKAGNPPPTTHLIEFLKTSIDGCPELVLLEEDMNFHKRAASLTDIKQSGGYILVATDIAARGVDLPETTHIYNFDLPKDAVHYLHRAGRTGRKPFSDSKCFVTSIVTADERFVLERFENELLFHCEELSFSV